LDDIDHRHGTAEFTIGIGDDAYRGNILHAISHIRLWDILWEICG